MFGWGRPKRPKAVAFDIIGTVFPIEPLRPSIIALGLPASGLEAWYVSAVRDALALCARGGFAAFPKVLASALDQLLAEQGLNPPGRARTAFLQQMRYLPARPDAAEAFRTVARAGMRAVALTNGTAAGTQALLEATGLNGLIDRIVSVDDVELYKPHRQVYAAAARAARVDQRKMALVSAHAWDIDGARAAGFGTVYLSKGKPFPPSMPTPDFQAPDLITAVELLAGL